MIPIEARIVAVADSFDAMTTRRPYREARPPIDAMRELRRVAGTQLDPEAVEAFVAAYPDPNELPVSA
jgi:HD-GYP domain-containing protein (c-di-GMP phosphodiesterase class II)